MELEEMKKNWNMMEERLERIEVKNQQQLTAKIKSTLGNLKKNLLFKLTFVVLFIPFWLQLATLNSGMEFSTLTWVLMTWFVIFILIRQSYWYFLVKKIDCLQMSVREVCMVESRFQLAFKVGMLVSVASAVPLLTSLIYDIAGFGNLYMLYGAWTGLALGLVLGIRLFLKAWGSVKELRETIANLK